MKPMKDHEKTTGWGGPRKRSKMIKKNAYEALGECIASDQVSPHKVALYFKDKDFLRWYQKKYWKKSR